MKKTHHTLHFRHLTSATSLPPPHFPSFFNLPPSPELLFIPHKFSSSALLLFLNNAPISSPLSPLTAMASQPALQGFDYSAKPKTWTKAIANSAYAQSQHIHLERLYSRAAELVNTQDLTAQAHRSRHKELSQKREETAVALAAEFGCEIEVMGHPDFAQRLCKGILTYFSHFGIAKGQREKSSAPSVAPSPVFVSPQTPAPPPSIPLADRQPPSQSRGLGAFEFNVDFPNTAFTRIPLKFRAERIAVPTANPEIQVSELSLDMLRALLMKREVFAADFDVIMYRAKDGMDIGIVDQADLETAVKHFQRYACSSMTVTIRSMDNLGKSHGSKLPRHSLTPRQRGAREMHHSTHSHPPSHPGLEAT